MLSYAQVYRNQFDLVTHGYGMRVYNLLRHVMNRMSLCMHRSSYYKAVEIIYQVSLHLNHRWCPVADFPDVLECAWSAYERPVARRWRRALLMARWSARLAKWRAAFVESWLRPGGLGEKQLAKHFANYATGAAQERT